MESREIENERRCEQRRCHRERRQEARNDGNLIDRRHATRRDIDRHIRHI